MEADFNATFEVIFNYGYDLCAFAHNICSSKPRIPDGMPGTLEPLSLEFFVNPQCPPDAVLIGDLLLQRQALAKRSSTPLPSGLK